MVIDFSVKERRQASLEYYGYFRHSGQSETKHGNF